MQFIQQIKQCKTIEKTTIKWYNQYYGNLKNYFK